MRLAILASLAAMALAVPLGHTYVTEGAAMATHSSLPWPLSAAPRELKSISLDGTPSSLAASEGTRHIYVTYNDIDLLSVLDSDTNTVTANVALPSGGAHTVAVNPSTNRVYVVNPGAGSVSVIDGATNSVVASIAVETRPASLPLAAIAVNSITNRIYVSWRGDPAGRGLAVIDGSSNEIVGTVNLDGVAYLLAVDAETNRIFAAIEFTAQILNVCPPSPPKLLAVVDGTTNTVSECVDAFTEALPQGGTAIGPGVTLVAEPTSRRLYLFNDRGTFPHYGSKLSVRDLTTAQAVAASTIAQSYPRGMALNLSHDRVYLIVVDWPDGWVDPLQSGRLLAMDGHLNSTIWTMPFASSPVAVAVNPDTGVIYVATSDRTLHVVDETPTTTPTPTSAPTPTPVPALPTPLSLPKSGGPPESDSEARPLVAVLGLGFVVLGGGLFWRWRRHALRTPSS